MSPTDVTSGMTESVGYLSAGQTLDAMTSEDEGWCSGSGVTAVMITATDVVVTYYNELTIM